MNIVSLFDGKSNGMIALERVGIRVDNYYSCEIDKYAMQISNKNYPGIIQLGDVSNLKPFLKLPKIDLLLGGSPCQGFSFAGKQLAFDDPRSRLFFEYVRILKDLKIINPDIKFLLENVRMKKEHLDVISEYLGVEPICINSSLVSAQNRTRYYWTNIEGIKQPEDKGIFLKDIVWQRPHGFNKGGFKIGKSPSITTSSWEQNNFIFQFPHGCSKGGVRSLEKSPTLTKQWHNNYFKLIHSEKAIDYMNRKVADGRTHWDFKHHLDINNPKSAAVVANFFKGVPYNVLKDWGCIRKFHPIECERLQTLPDNYTEGVSATQRYKMIGNGWTVDVIAHILKGLEEAN